MSSRQDSGRPYHLECTGAAQETAKAHSNPENITLFGSCFCPFVQRVWVTLEHLGFDYKYYEVDPYKKPAELLELSPKGLVPALRLDGYNPPRALNESTVIMDFLLDLAASNTKRSSHTTESLFPPLSDPYARALIRLQSDTVNRSLVPAFYRYLQAQDEEKQIEGAKGFLEAIDGLVKLFERAEREGCTSYGLWHERGSFSYADVMLAHVSPSSPFHSLHHFEKPVSVVSLHPGSLEEAVWWPRILPIAVTGAGSFSGLFAVMFARIFRATNVLKHYRGFVLPEGARFRAYVDRLLNHWHPAFKRTCSTEQLYLDSYERYAFNRPNTSQVANAINAGTALP